MRFDPPAADQAEREASSQAQILAELDGVSCLDDDRILRSHLGLIQATVRTNAFRRGDGDLSLQIRCGDVPGMPLPFPMWEIFVYSPAMAGVHLRGGMVARGGIRWSDRPEDYRTEILGLMKAQMVKNAVIVPVGAKGGFVSSTRPPTGASSRRRCVRQYVTLMRGLLDVTDNLVDGEVVQPGRRAGAGRATTRTWWSRPTRAPPRSPTPPTRSARVRLLAGRRVRLRRLGRLRPQEAGDHRRAAPGRASSATSASWAGT